MSSVEDLLEVCRHFSREYLDQKLSAWFGEEVKYTQHKYSEGAGKGDSYLSDVYRIEFYGKTVAENKEVSIRTVIKTFPKNIARRKTFTSHIFFKNEINFYEKVLPVLLEFQSSKNIEEPFECIPKVFAAITDGENDFLALEDLSVNGFTSAVRQEGIDYPHLKITLETFGKFHALSFALHDQNPALYETLKGKIKETYYYKENWDWYKNFWASLCRCVINAVEQEYPDSIYVEKIKEFATEKAFDRLASAADSTVKTAVFSHGDSWTPNFLYKYKPETNIPYEAKMIDFQLARCASPILDIGFFIYACSTEDVRREYYQSMLQIYHEALTKQIRALGSDPEKIYSWDTFIDEVKKLSYFGLGFSFESVPTIILDPEDAFDMELKGTEKVDISTIWVVGPIKNKKGRARLAGNVKHAVDNNFI